MATFDGDLNGSSNVYEIRLEMVQTSQNQGANTSLVTWRAYLVSNNNAFPAWYLDSDNTYSVTVNGSTSSGSFGFDFRPSSSTKVIQIASGTRTVTHDGNGYKTVSGSASVNTAHSSVGDGSVSGSLTLTRIPKAPDAPGTPSVGTVTTTSVPLSWAAPADVNGDAVENYQVQRATNSGFTTGTGNTDSGTSRSVTVSSLTPGTNYWFRVRADNVAGYGSYSSARATATLPAAPTALNATSETPSSFTLNWTAPSGNGITAYEIQQSNSSGFSSPTTWTQSGTSRAMTGLAPAVTYYYRVRAQTLGGVGAWSSTFTSTPGLPAPTLGTVQTDTSSWMLDVSWSAPSITTGLTGYRVQAAAASDFSGTVHQKDVGNVLTTELNIPGGKRYYVRVAALTAGGVNEWSTSTAVVHQLNAGNLDGWTRVGTKPANISYYTSQGIRRATVNGYQALLVESLSTASVTLNADTYGIQKVISGLTIGAAYRFEAQGAILGSPLADSYRLSVVSESSATPVTLGSASLSLGYIEFVADATSVTLRIMLAESVSVTGAQPEVERAGFHTIKFTKLVTDYPQRLRGTVFESTLVNHLDLASNSVGASWYVAKDGVTRFRLPGDALPVAAVFSDEVDEASVSYVDITAGYDTRTTVNRIEATNYGRNGTVEENDELIVEDTASQAAYGVYRSTLALNLYDEAPYDDSFAERLDELLEANKTPQARVSAIRWNAQEDLELARALEVGDRITVRYRGADYDSQIVNLTHEITPTRWMVTLTLLAL